VTKASFSIVQFRNQGRIFGRHEEANLRFIFCSNTKQSYHCHTVYFVGNDEQSLEISMKPNRSK